MTMLDFYQQCRCAAAWLFPANNLNQSYRFCVCLGLQRSHLLVAAAMQIFLELQGSGLV